MIKVFLKLLVAMMCMSGINSWATVINVVNQDGKLIGAHGVRLFDMTFNVAFVEGSCRELYNGCTTFDFDVVSKDSVYGYIEKASWAGQAALALKEQVFVGSYDTDPSKTFGCESPYDCYVVTPYKYDLDPDMGYLGGVVGMWFDNDFGTIDRTQELGWVTSDQSSGGSDWFSSMWVYTKWTLSSNVPVSPVSVPEPQTLPLLLLGIIALMCTKQRLGKS